MFPLESDLSLFVVDATDKQPNNHIPEPEDKTANEFHYQLPLQSNKYTSHIQLEVGVLTNPSNIFSDNTALSRLSGLIIEDS